MLAVYFFRLMFFFIFITAPSFVLADISSQGWGRVNMKGIIVDTACSIFIGSRDQTIDMEVISISEIIREGKGPNKPFTIKLGNCVLSRQGNNQPDWKQFQVTFDGNRDGFFFGVDGEASGVGLQIKDAIGNVAIPGRPMPRGDISLGDFDLNYNLQLVANKRKLKAGDYFSLVRFKLDYF